MKLFVEGGGDSHSLKAECRKGFTTFLTKAGITMRPRVVASGSRQSAYEDFCHALKQGEEAMLLVDAESAVATKYQTGVPEIWQPWAHLRDRDRWERPSNSTDMDCHLMVQIMESWFLADRTTLARFFGAGFAENALPASTNPIEPIDKSDVYRVLEQSTKNVQSKGKYGKAAHSFKLLCDIDPTNVIRACPWAARFILELKKKMGA